MRSPLVSIWSSIKAVPHHQSFRHLQFCLSLCIVDKAYPHGNVEACSNMSLWHYDFFFFIQPCVHEQFFFLSLQNKIFPHQFMTPSIAANPGT